MELSHVGRCELTFDPAVRFGMPVRRMKLASTNFADSASKLAALATPLDRSENGQFDHLRACVYQVRKFGVHFGINWSEIGSLPLLPLPFLLFPTPSSIPVPSAFPSEVRHAAGFATARRCFERCSILLLRCACSR